MDFSGITQCWSCCFLKELVGFVCLGSWWVLTHDMWQILLQSEKGFELGGIAIRFFTITVYNQAPSPGLHPIPFPQYKPHPPAPLYPFVYSWIRCLQFVDPTNLMLNSQRNENIKIVTSQTHRRRLVKFSNSTEFIPTCLIKSLVVSRAVRSSSSCSWLMVTTESFTGPFLPLFEGLLFSLSELVPLKASGCKPSWSARAVSCESVLSFRSLSWSWSPTEYMFSRSVRRGVLVSTDISEEFPTFKFTHEASKNVLKPA